MCLAQIGRTNNITENLAQVVFFFFFFFHPKIFSLFFNDLSSSIIILSTMFRQVFRQVTKQSFTGVTRTYATESAVSSDALKLSLALPHQTLYNDSEVQQVNLPSVNGDLGILANHIPIVEQLRPGLLEIISKNGDSDQYFVSGGIAMVQPGNKLTISAIEAFKTDQIDISAVKNLIADAQKRAESSDEKVAAEANIELEVLEALQHFTK